MNLRHVISSTAIASALIFTGVACSTPSSAPVEVTSPVAVTPSAPVTSGDEEAILTTVNGFYEYVTTPANADKVAAAGERFADRSEVSDEEVNQLAKDYPEIFQHFDTSTPQNVKNAYGQLVAGVSLAASIEGIKVVAPVEAVKQNGDTATVNSTMVKVTTPEKTMDSAADPESTDLINLIKKDGKWLMVATTPLS